MPFQTDRFTSEKFPPPPPLLHPTFTNRVKVTDKIELVPRRGVIVVSIVSAEGEVCIAYSSGFSQFMRPEAYSWIFVRVKLGWLSNRSMYQTFSVNASLCTKPWGLKQTTTNPFNLTFQFERYFGNVCFASPWLRTKGKDLLKMSDTCFSCLVNQAILWQMSKNMPRVSWID